MFSDAQGRIIEFGDRWGSGERSHESEGVASHLERFAPLTFVLTRFSSVTEHAGLLHDFPYPVCGCEVCDDSWAHLADNSERDVLAVAHGNYRERVEVRCTPLPSTWVGHDFCYEWGATTAGGMPTRGVRAA